MVLMLVLVTSILIMELVIRILMQALIYSEQFLNLFYWENYLASVKNVYLSKVIHIEPHTKYFKMYIVYGGTSYYIISRNKKLIDKLYDRARGITSNA